MVALVAVLVICGLGGGPAHATAGLLGNHGTESGPEGYTISSLRVYVTYQLWLWSTVRPALIFYIRSQLSPPQAWADILITGILCLRLFAIVKRSESAPSSLTTKELPMVSLRHWLSTFIRMMLTCALSTSLCSVTAAILWVLTYQPSTLAFAFLDILPGLYGLCCLYVLTSRHRFSTEVQATSTEDAVQVRLASHA